MGDVLLQLRHDYCEYYTRIGRPIPLTEAIDELRIAFDSVEQSSPGTTRDLLCGILNQLATAANTLSPDDLSQGLASLKISPGNMLLYYRSALLLLMYLGLACLKISG